jgi:enoyl-CoA hydratase/carnithine racemase
MPSICQNSKVAFNEVAFGFTPHAGSCYYASRLPGEFGTFMVLTGTQISGKDAIELGVADRLLIHNEYENELSHIL